jgi:hypothetical protein
VRETLKIILALPIYQVAHAIAYAMTYVGWVARVAVFITFLPVIIFSTVIWLANWFIVVSLVLMFSQ